MPDLVKMFRKNDPGGIEPGEEVLAVVRVAFADGSVRAFDSGKRQRLDELVEAVARSKTS
jgi:hypothetical protein